ncbi:3-deoxy-D-manno-octulosonic acid transferase [bacterium]|nr:3-deoxy-D-manno-octulosonic acid transferase [bacterium]
MPTRFDLIYSLSVPVLVPYLAWRRLSRGKYTESAGGMLGRRLPDGAPFADGSLWVHAVSVGEIAAARAVVPGLRELAPELPLVVSTITETGQASARQAFPDAALTYFPADFSANVRRFQNVFNPKIFVLLETELWPNFLAMAAARGTRCYMLNGKLSDRSFPRYRRFRKFLAPALGALGGVCAQTDEDARRFEALGIDPAHIRVTGNCKFDLAQKPLTDPERRALAVELGLTASRRWIVAGSTHPGEETAILAAYSRLIRDSALSTQGAGLLLCPRHPERFDEVVRLCEQAGLRTARASAPDPSSDPEVVVLDRMGVLARAYGLGDIAIVAGSFCPIGGHNLLEAAAHRVPVVYGPDMHSQRELDRLFRQARAGIQVRADELAAKLAQLMADDALRRAEGEKAHAVLERNQGSAARAIAALSEWLGQKA